jgi:HD-GYP domain-containing protein (c-di-GMP phosphodiesterase class II)
MSDLCTNVIDDPAAGYRLNLSEVIGAMSYALDLTEGQPAGHSLRSCWIAMRIGRHIGLDAAALSSLYYCVLLKDAGCSSNAARLWTLYGGDERVVKRAYKTVNSQRLTALARFVLEHAGPDETLRRRIERILTLKRHGHEFATDLIQTRCERGADIVRRLGFGRDVADGVYCLDEHWNGKGRPANLAGEAIPLNARISLLAQVADVFHAVGGPEAARREVSSRAGTWFDPRLVRAFRDVADDAALWEGLRDAALDARVRASEPAEAVLLIDEAGLDAASEAFADVIDAKSSFTSGHSRRVADYATEIARRFGIGPQRRRWLRRVGLLHDIGKLGVSNGILDKPGKLDEGEWQAIRRHPALSEEILGRVGIFRNMAPVAGAHHERLDGKGYPRGLAGAEISLETRIITAADVFDALTAERPYRSAMPAAQALAIMERDRDRGIDGDCLRLLAEMAKDGDRFASSSA